MLVEDILTEKKKLIDSYLDRYLPDEDEEPEVLSRAMRYTLFAGGKRIRPILSLLAYEACGGRDMEEIMPLACAIELIHTFSLIHDDLPAMDNDDYRRGKPTSHKVFGEAIAILAGDALFSYALRLVLKSTLQPSILLRALDEILDATGINGMIGGQVEDLLGEKCEPTPERVRSIHVKKTAALIRASLTVGGIAAATASETINRLREAGENLGMAFQIVDDILDETGKKERLGKSTHKDRGQGKCTYPRVFGLEKSRHDAMEYKNIAKRILRELFGNRAEPLELIADFVVERAY